MSNAATRSNALALRTLNARLVAQRAELAICTTVAMTRCVEDAMADTRRQMRELMGPAQSSSLQTALLGSSDASETRAATLAQFDAKISYLDRLIAVAEGMAAVEAGT